MRNRNTRTGMKRVGVIALTGMMAMNLMACGSQKEIEVGTIERSPMPNPYGYYENPKLTELPEFDEFEGYQLSGADLTGMDLSKEYEKLKVATFDSTTKWSGNLPGEFHPDEILKRNMTPGLKIKALHEKRIDGTGVNVAMIDQPLLIHHIEYDGKIKHYEEIGKCKDWVAQMHGSSVTSILAGDKVGVAPGCNIYYIATDGEIKNNIKAMKRIVEMNQMMPENEKIRAISFSTGYMETDAGYKEYIEAVKEVEENGIAFLSCSAPHKTQTNGVTSDAALSPYDGESYLYNGLYREEDKNPDDFNAYINDYQYYEYDTKTLCVPEGSRVLASETGISDYRYDSFGGTSWGAPYIAGVYALACQVQPDITFEKFWKIAQDTAVVIQNEGGEKSGNVINAEGIITFLQSKSN